MFLDLGIYLTVFESRYLATTESFYISESTTLLNKMVDGSLNGLAVRAYLEHGERRMEEERIRCSGVNGSGAGAGNSGYLSVATRKSAISIVEGVLVEIHVLTLLSR
ncbi:UNVERIFIED_CONTAM: hypothetical protein HDU68_006974, partial [Siphonaria sp. JEL0065]